VSGEESFRNLDVNEFAELTAIHANSSHPFDAYAITDGKLIDAFTQLDHFSHAFMTAYLTFLRRIWKACPAVHHNAEV
jgi:hypothetical protein